MAVPVVSVASIVIAVIVVRDLVQTDSVRHIRGFVVQNTELLVSLCSEQIVEESVVYVV